MIQGGFVRIGPGRTVFITSLGWTALQAYRVGFRHGAVA